MPIERITEKDKLLILDKRTALAGRATDIAIAMKSTQGAERWLLTPDHLSMYVDLKRCIGCFACETSCKHEHDLPMGPRLMRLIQVGPKKVGRHTKTIYYPMNCFHCGNAPCIPACPTGAMIKREDNGIVFVDSDKCIGCKQCIQACPFGAPQYDTRSGKVIKCDFCMDRVDKGLQPACVVKCSADCLYFGNWDYISTYMREKQALSLASAYMNGKDTDTLASPAYAFPERNLFIPPIRRKPGKLRRREVHAAVKASGKPWRPQEQM